MISPAYDVYGIGALRTVKRDLSMCELQAAPATTATRHQAAPALTATPARREVAMTTSALTRDGTDVHHHLREDPRRHRRQRHGRARPRQGRKRYLFEGEGL
jgi:hypothetical protein